MKLTIVQAIIRLFARRFGSRRASDRRQQDIVERLTRGDPDKTSESL